MASIHTRTGTAQIWIKFTHPHTGALEPSGLPLPQATSRRRTCSSHNHMAKRPKTLRVRIPPYVHPRTSWRKSLHAEMLAAAKTRGIVYSSRDKLELSVILYLDQVQLRFHDVDNRLKDIMDALQGRAGGPNAVRRLQPLVPNDHQIYRVMIEKRPPPGQSHGLGHLVVRKYRAE